ncbi:hypothetical protein BE08_28340 [Sorangium cellulosum]|uniref:Uncharacterized protein n=1 Tax=Sorangium cellulosum TaxID=56 RepID=A0A150PUR6_SORCE|nr:hypothetical protein BE08_28340 [Sorangium cellulosum]
MAQRASRHENATGARASSQTSMSLPAPASAETAGPSALASNTTVGIAAPPCLRLLAPWRAGAPARSAGARWPPGAPLSTGRERIFAGVFTHYTTEP